MSQVPSVPERSPQNAVFWTGSSGSPPSGRSNRVTFRTRHRWPCCGHTSGSSAWGRKSCRRFSRSYAASRTTGSGGRWNRSPSKTLYRPKPWGKGSSDGPGVGSVGRARGRPRAWKLTGIAHAGTPPPTEEHGALHRNGRDTRPPAERGGVWGDAAAGGCLETSSKPG